jgi:putative MATE family efflux protein
MASSAVVARRVGEKDLESAAKSAAQAGWLALICTIVISLAGLFFAPDLLHLMGAEPATIQEGIQYTRIMMTGSFVILLLFLINGIFRGAGDAFMAMKSLWVANAFNIILCPFFIYGIGGWDGLGVTGAAVATTLGRGIGVAYQLWHLFKGSSILKLRQKYFLPDLKLIRSLVKIAAPGTLQFIIGSCSWIVLAGLVARTGHATASAGYQTAIRMLIFFILPAWGMSNAAATLVGQNLGANNPGRAAISVWQTARYNMVFMLAITILTWVMAPWMISFFTENKPIQQEAVRALRIICSGYVFYGLGMVLTNAFNGAGDTRTPTWINFVGFWLVQIPLAYALAIYWKQGVTGIFWAIPISETCICIISFYIFRKGNWKKVVV